MPTRIAIMSDNGTTRDYKISSKKKSRQEIQVTFVPSLADNLDGEEYQHMDIFFIIRYKIRKFSVDSFTQIPIHIFNEMLMIVLNYIVWYN